MGEEAVEGKGGEAEEEVGQKGRKERQRGKREGQK